jgi:isopenicillin-N N-acyltransferase like protein
MKRCVAFCVVVFAVAGASGDEPKRFPEAKHKAGELKYIDKVPVLTVRGTPAEMGEQFGQLAVANAPALDALHAQFLKDTKREKQYPLIAGLSARLKPAFPKHISEELEAVAKQSKREESLLLFANTVADLTSGMGCSTVIVEKDRSATGKPLFGRNFDWFPTKGITEHTLVVVYKGEKKRAFAAVTVCPIQGAISGMNDAGLCVTINEIRIREAKGKHEFNMKGTPLLFAFRQVLEECGTVAEAEKLLRAGERTSTCCMTICDKSGGAVFELTPKGVEVRAAVNGVCCCTNHFRTDALSLTDKCERYEKLAPLQAKGGAKLDVPGVFGELKKVQQGAATLQSMVFEPAERVLHLAYGPGPATDLKPTKLDLGLLFDAK